MLARIKTALSGLGQGFSYLHQRTNGISTNLYARGTAASIGLLTGAITLDSIIDWLANGQHGWSAGAEPVEIPPNYEPVGSSTGDCYKIVHYANRTEYERAVSDASLPRAHSISVQHDMPDCITRAARMEATRVEFYQRIGMASAAAAIAAVGGYLWRRRKARISIEQSSESEFLEITASETPRIEELFGAYSKIDEKIEAGEIDEKSAKELLRQTSIELCAEIRNRRVAVIKSYYFGRVSKSTHQRLINTAKRLLNTFEIKQT